MHIPRFHPSGCLLCKNSLTPALTLLCTSICLLCSSPFIRLFLYSSSLFSATLVSNSIFFISASTSN